MIDNYAIGQGLQVAMMADSRIATTRAKVSMPELKNGVACPLGALILEIAAHALALEPRIGQHGPRVTVLTVGSTALKIGLHPAAHTFRRRVQSLVDAPAIQWIECQAHTDVINFYKTDPVAAMDLQSQRSDAFPQVHVVRVRDMLQPEAYKRFKFNLFRVHYQFIMANTRRYAYDFFMMCCGEQLFAEMLGDSLRYRPAPESHS